MSKYHNISDEQLVSTILDFEAELKEVQSDLKEAKESLLQRKESEIQDLLKAKDEPFGSVNIKIGKFKVCFDTPKKVTWDQEKLLAVYKQIEADGADPTEYVKAKYEVSETKYKAWPSNIKEYFVDARTVQPGNCAIKIEEKA